MKLDLRSDCHALRQFEGFFKVPVKAPTRGYTFYGYSKNSDQLGFHKQPKDDQWAVNHDRNPRVKEEEWICHRHCDKSPMDYMQQETYSHRRKLYVCE